VIEMRQGTDDIDVDRDDNRKIDKMRSRGARVAFDLDCGTKCTDWAGVNGLDRKCDPETTHR